MPSPIGHAIGAVAAALPAAGRESPVRWRAMVWLAAFGMAPDLDLLFGRHSMETHSVGAAVIAAALAACCRLPVAATRGRVFVATLLAWLSHPLFDALGTDTSEPIGVMLLWPFSSEHVAFVPVFDAVSRRYWLPGFVERTMLAIARELVILAPLLLASWWWTGRRGSALRRGQS
jgi:hypothetical protein